MKGNIWAVLPDSPWGSKEIFHVLCNPKTTRRVQRSGSLGPNLEHLKQVHPTYHTFFLFKIQFNILIPSSPTCSLFHSTWAYLSGILLKGPGVDTTVVNILNSTHTHTHTLQYNHITRSLAFLPFILKLFTWWYVTFDILYQSIRLTFGDIRATYKNT